MAKHTYRGRYAGLLLAVALILALIATPVFTGFFKHYPSHESFFSLPAGAHPRATLQGSLTDVNETVVGNATNPTLDKYSSPDNSTDSSSSSSNFTLNGYTGKSHLSSFLADTGSGQMDESVAYLSMVSKGISPNLNASRVILSDADFNTCTYGEYPVPNQDLVQNQDPEYFNFSFPDCMNWGQIAGSDAVSSNTYAIHEINFDVSFITPSKCPNGFDEMAIFAASDTITYKGTEFGVRMDLSDGYVYGYIQEPIGELGEVDFRTVNLMPNDGLNHHYSIVVEDSLVLFNVDGIRHGYLFFANHDPNSNLAYSVCAVVHRFNDYWNSSGDAMIAGNFTIN